MTSPDQDSVLRPLPCPECKYDLAGLPTGNCPECGRAFTPEQVRDYWIHHKARTRFPKFPLSIVVIFLTLSCLIYTHTITVRAVLTTILVAGLISLVRNHLKSSPPRPPALVWSIVFLIANLAVIHYSIQFHDSLARIALIEFLLILHVFASIFLLRETEGRRIVRIAWLAPLYGPALLAAHAISRYHTWSDYNYLNTQNSYDEQNGQTAVLGNHLLFVVFAAVAANFVLAFAFEFWLKSRHPITSSTHSPAAESAPPSQAEP